MTPPIIYCSVSSHVGRHKITPPSWATNSYDSESSRKPEQYCQTVSFLFVITVSYHSCLLIIQVLKKQQKKNIYFELQLRQILEALPLF